MTLKTRNTNKFHGFEILVPEKMKWNEMKESKSVPNHVTQSNKSEWKCQPQNNQSHLLVDISFKSNLDLFLSIELRQTINEWKVVETVAVSCNKFLFDYEFKCVFVKKIIINHTKYYQKSAC